MLVILVMQVGNVAHVTMRRSETDTVIQFPRLYLHFIEGS